MKRVQVSFGRNCVDRIALAEWYESGFQPEVIGSIREVPRSVQRLLTTWRVSCPESCEYIINS